MEYIYIYIYENIAIYTHAYNILRRQKTFFKAYIHILCVASTSYCLIYIIHVELSMFVGIVLNTVHTSYSLW